MSNLDAVVAAKIRDEDVSLAQLLRRLKVSGQLGALLAAAIDDVLVAQAAQRRRISASDDEMQQAADAFRQHAGLEKASDTQQWLQQNNLDLDGFEARLERAILIDKLKTEVAKDKIEMHFAENRAAFDHAVLAHIVVQDEGVAQELLSQIQEGEALLGELAPKHSIDKNTKDNGGRLGLVNRKSLSPAVESAVFSAQPGDVVGPIKSASGYHIILVEEIRLGELNDAIAATIREQLFGAWLADERKNAGVQIKLYDAV